ncbi:VWA domain-containing protein [Rossellomorea sp. KS-H15a]|uniref:vWA domain-containing protein n=1 Tax=Rossellomorea sp. KS-H15a TaxID=2963940 RepID=UPI0020C64208|nr:VWA domain-containing protein [Rossellomorea sp. KS-H15a]UTE78000.1 VWA domain-containing protein [Rossellomorea sp. KS-H15a]
MSKNLFITILVICLSFAIAGCQSDDDKSDGSKEAEMKNESSKVNEQEKDEKNQLSNYPELFSVPDAPKTMEEVIDYPAGPYANAKFEKNNEEIVKEINQLPAIKGSADGEFLEAYWNQLLSLFAVDYKDPQIMLEKLKVKSFGSPELEDPRYQFKDNLNVEIILDASGSMKAQVKERTKMELAKEAIDTFASSLPKESKVALRVYGHKGTGSDKDKEMSCKANEKVYDFQSYDTSKLNQSLNGVEAKGWTPVAASLREAHKDLSQFPAEQNTNIIFLVSDGIETCDGNPVEVAKSLKDSSVKPIVNIIGFDVDAEGQKQLQDVAENASGSYANVYDLDELNSEFNRAEEIAKQWESWKSKALNNNDLEQYLNTSEISEFTYDWSYKRIKENNNLLGVILYLKDKGELTDEAYSYLSDKAKRRQKDVFKYSKDIKSELHKVNDASYEETKSLINEKFNKNKD